MLTLFSVPKPFRGDIARLQENAVATWAALDGVEVILFGDEEGTAEAAHAAGVRYGDDVARNAHGTPRIDALFSVAESEGSGELLGFVNADILLPPRFPAVLEEVRRELGEFVGLGQCLDLEIDGRLPADWEEAGRKHGTLRGPGGIDYLVFSRGQFASLPPFVLGRAYFDNWLVWRARRDGVPVVDLTEVVAAVHQQHDYSHVAGGKGEAYAGEEALRNLELAGGRLHLFNVDDATHRLTEDGLRRNLLAPVRALASVRWLVLHSGALARRVRRRETPFA